MKAFNRLDLNLLRIFDLLMNEGSVSKVAEHINLSQSTVSHALSRLRQQLGNELFIPVRGGMMPTDQAKRMAPSIRHALMLMEQAVHNGPVFNSTNSKQSFRIAGSDYVELILLPPLLKRFKETAPHISIQLEELNNSDYLRELENEKLDLVIGFEKPDHLSHRLLNKVFLQESMVVISAKPLGSQGKPLQAKKLEQLSFIYPSNWGHTQSLMEQWCEKNRIKRQLGITVSGFVAIPELMKQLDMVAALPRAIALYYEKYFRFFWYSLADEQLCYRHKLAWHPLRENDPALSWLCSQIIEVGENLK
ncbi:Nodulation protein D 2 [invertebrate metagenome]|uniref:Nodulation protein D 2 n=1 Tax=invertebrate metagenome TaxID=1711999 RepID=A0A2H9TAF2_9ZZZZ